MDKLRLKWEQISSVYDRLDEAVNLFKDFDKTELQQSFMSKESMYRIFRDSLIKRFEFTVDLFWKYLKRYLNDQGQKVEFNTPKFVIKSACKAKILTEKDSEIFIAMIDTRNMTSHMYKEEMADKIATSILSYSDLIKKYIKDLEA